VRAATLTPGPASPPATIFYLITADDGFSKAETSVLIDSTTEAASVEKLGILNPVGDLTELRFGYPETHFAGTIGTADIPFVLNVAPFLERVSDPTAENYIARFPLGDDGTFVSQSMYGGYVREGFSLSIEAGGALLGPAVGADCVPRCIGGSAVATVRSGAITELRFEAGVLSANRPTLSLGTDPLGVSWSVEVLSAWPEYTTALPQMVFVPEPATFMLTAPGLVVLALARGRVRSDGAD
jgi:hypothetical protein